MTIPSQYPLAQDFISAIAQPFDSDLGRRIVEPFGIIWSDAIKLDRNLEIYHIEMQQSLGIGLTYNDIALVFKDEDRRAGDGPFLMTNCSFWGHEDGCATYKGPLWKDLQFSDTPADVIAKLGAPTGIGRFDIHRWKLPDFKLTIQWKSPSNIRVISYWMKPVE